MCGHRKWQAGMNTMKLDIRFLLYPGRLTSGVARPTARWPAIRAA
jgi:hypothetical protein